MSDTTFRDEVSEWRCLSALLHKDNGEWINRINSALFTGRRETIFQAMRDAYALYGEVTYEGIRTTLNDAVPNELSASQGANIRATIDDLARIARKRQATKISATLKELAEQHNPKIEQIQASLVVDPIMAEEDSLLTVGAQHLLADLQHKKRGDYVLRKSGFKFFDNSMGGEYKESTVIVYGGSPGTGKTTLTAQSILAMAEGYVCEKTGEKIVTPSLFLSLEMSKKDIIIKWLGNKLSIDTQDILAGRLDEDQFKQIEELTIHLQSLPAYIIDNPALTLAQMAYEIRKHVYRYGVRVVFIDYLQVVNYAPNNNANKDLGDFAWHMKQLAKQLKITIVILSQITPGNDGTFRIRNSGDVGSHVDAVFEAELETDTGAIQNVVVTRTKNRLGPLGKSALLFNSPYQRFEESSS